MLNLLNNLLAVDNDVSEKESRSRKKVTMLGRLPRYFPKKRLEVHIGGELSNYSKKANRYLEHQEQRISRALYNKDYNKAYFI